MFLFVQFNKTFHNLTLKNKFQNQGNIFGIFGWRERFEQFFPIFGEIFKKKKAAFVFIYLIIIQ